MRQFQLFDESVATLTIARAAGAAPGWAMSRPVVPPPTSTRSNEPLEPIASAFEVVSHADIRGAGEDDRTLASEESDVILRCLHATTWGDFRQRLEPLLTSDERNQLEAARPLPFQLAHFCSQVHERLLRRWAELNDWPPFARVAERSALLRRGFRACTLELFPPGSRGLEGNVAFRMEPNLRRVTAPIPTPVLKSLAEVQSRVFQSVFYLEPIYAPRTGRQAPTLLRSLEQVRRHHCRPIDPLVCGLIGSPLEASQLPFPPRDGKSVCQAVRRAGGRAGPAGVVNRALGLSRNRGEPQSGYW